MENRTEQLKELCAELDESSKIVTLQLIDEMVFLETRLQKLRELPFIAYNRKNPMQQIPTAASKQYKEFLQQYNNCIKIFLSVLGKDTGGETSPLREYLNRIRNGGVKFESR